VEKRGRGSSHRGRGTGRAHPSFLTEGEGNEKRGTSTISKRKTIQPYKKKQKARTTHGENSPERVGGKDSALKIEGGTRSGKMGKYDWGKQRREDRHKIEPPTSNKKKPSPFNQKGSFL